MALIKEINTNYGVKADYWRIESITIDKRMKEANFIMHLYLNKEATQSFDYRAVVIADKENKDELLINIFQKILLTQIFITLVMSVQKKLMNFLLMQKMMKKKLRKNY